MATVPSSGASQARQVIAAGAGVPAPRGGYSPAIVAGGQIFVAGQVPVDGRGQVISDGGVSAQAELALDNLAVVLAAAGASLSDVVRATVYLADLDDTGAADEAWRRRFPSEPPARTTIGCQLRPGIRYEIDAVAVLPDPHRPDAADEPGRAPHAV